MNDSIPSLQPRQILNGIHPRKVAIQGYEGSFHHMATQQYFGVDPLQLLPANNFRQLVELVESGEADCALMAIENSLAGSIAHNYTLLLESELIATGEVYLPIHQHLMVWPGVRLEEIEEVHSHPMALAQCGRFLRQHPHLRLVETEDTALSARRIAEGKLKKVAAIGPEIAARHYGLEIIREHVEDNAENFTRFLVLHRKAEVLLPEQAGKVSVCFTLPHKVGSLHKLLGELAGLGANLTKIQSMPIVGKPWEYFFFTDFTLGNSISWRQCLKAVRPLTGTMDVIGVFAEGKAKTRPAPRDKTIKAASRLDGINEYFFAKKLREIAEMERNGRRIINLGIGSPDLPPPAAVTEKLAQSALQNHAHRYQPYRGIPGLRTAMSNWYRRHFGVELDPASEVLPLIGSKEGIFHIAMTFLGKGDEALVPNPGYPSYRAATRLAGATAVEYLLSEENNWLPDLETLEKQDLSRVKLMWVNYPHMPTGAAASPAFFEKLIAFAKRHGILLVNDNPYAFILNEQPCSLLSAGGSEGICMELNSLSKSHNMAGWRVGMLAGAPALIDQVVRFKSNVDSGQFLAVQEAAIEALKAGPDWYRELNAVYSLRKTAAMALLEQLGCRPAKQQAGMFLWARVPKGWKDGFEISEALLQAAGVFLTPGGIFGSQGKDWIRISLCSPVEDFELASEKIAHSQTPLNPSQPL
ncbi:MAG: hypothetical protein Kow0027_30510 [Saprospiraceae bacterium]